MSSSRTGAEPIPPRRWDLTGLERLVVALGVAVAIAVAVVHRTTPLAAAGLAAVLVVSTWLSVVDLRTHRLPNRVVGPLAAAVVGWLLIAGLVGDELDRAVRAIGLGVLVAAVLLLANVLGGLGMGDVKYGFPAGATLGWFGAPTLVTAAIVTTAVGAVVAVWLLLRGAGRGHAIPYGPAMAVGLAVGLLTAGPA